MKVVTRIMLGFVAILLCGITACQVHYYKARRTPAVSGKVVDIETGEPIKGADVRIEILADFPNYVDKTARLSVAEGLLKTDKNGKFSFPSQELSFENMRVSLPYYLFLGPPPQAAIGVCVFSKDYITVPSETGGFEWKEDSFFYDGFKGEDGKQLIWITREKNIKKGFDYTVQVKKAVTEKDWEEKCRLTLLHTDISGEPDESFRFNDLVGYLERYPNGEKAGEYIGSLIEHCDTACYDDMKNQTQVQRKKMIKLLAFTLLAIDHADHITIYKLNMRFNMEKTIRGMKEALICLNKLES